MSRWLEAQWALWWSDAVLGKLPAQGFERFATRHAGPVEPVRGDAWGTHWQKGRLRILPWGIWLEEDEDALVYWAERNQVYVSDRWLLEPNGLSCPAEPDALLEATLECEGSFYPERWARLQGLVGPSVAQEWFEKVALPLLMKRGADVEF
jgi:hypothetical protein